MTPETFIARWQDNPLTERAGAQAHFDDLCDLLGVAKPRDPENYCFERGAQKAGGGDGWADVWKRGCFGWENKKPGRDLKAALKQLNDYAGDLDNPPLRIVCDREIIEIHTAFVGYPDLPRIIHLADLADESARQTLRWAFEEPEKLRPEKSTATITLEMAGAFADLAAAMRARVEGSAPPALSFCAERSGVAESTSCHKTVDSATPGAIAPSAQNDGGEAGAGVQSAPSRQDRQRISHFLMQCVFCFFAEDEGVLPAGIFTRLLDKASDPARAKNRIAALFAAMAEKGGVYGDDDVPWFNGGLFKTCDIPDLSASDLSALRSAAAMDWRAIDPTIFGTLFERGLESNDRAKLGAHYTDPATIEKLIAPVVREPLLREWAQTRSQIEAALARKKGGQKEAEQHYQRFLLRLENFRVLDPACGSGNFLYLSLRALREVEARARRDAAALGLPEGLSMHTGPHNILGLEINEFAAELARVTVWIGDIQWSRQNGYPYPTNPILKPLEGIEQRDALLAASPVILREGGEAPVVAESTCEAGDMDSATSLRYAQNDGAGGGARNDGGNGTIAADWPPCDVIVGNPPFLGGSKKRRELGDVYFDRLNAAYPQVPGGADLVCYWFYRAREHIQAGKAKAAGLVSTNSIRGGANRAVLDAIADETPIFEAWSDEPWVNAGAAVRVSLICFGKAPAPAVRLDGKEVERIHADLSAQTGVDLTGAVPLKENANCSFQGSQKIGAFDIDGELARTWLKLPNVNGKPNSTVVKPSWNGLDVTRRPRDGWIIDFGATLSEADAAMFEKPFEYALEHVKPERIQNPRPVRAKNWWRHGDPQPAMRAALSGLPRYIATPEVAKHRFFIWLDHGILPDKRLIVIACSDDATFGILSSRFHELWSLRLGSTLEDRPCYRPSTSFETFPFPAGFAPADPARHSARSEAESQNPLGAKEVDSATTGALPPVRTMTDETHAAAIAEAAKTLNTLRENWLNPPQWVDWLRTPEEEAAGFPPRPVAKPGFEAELKKRTLTNLYNERPAWLAMAHEALDKAVAAAYGWEDYAPEMTDAEILKRLLALNRSRAQAAASAAGA